MNQVAESVASLALAEAEAEGINSDRDDDKNDKPKSASELVEQEEIQVVEEVKLGDTGVSGAFVKEVLQGKEIIFVIGDSLTFSLSYHVKFFLCLFSIITGIYCKMLTLILLKPMMKPAQKVGC